MEKPDVFGCFQRSLKPKKISGRFHCWTFGFLEVAVILAFLLWIFVMKSVSDVFGHSDYIWMFITSVLFWLSKGEKKSQHGTAT